MRVKTYRGGSTAQVLGQVKAELGPDAVILSTKSLRENGRSLVEVMAAVEEPQTPAQPGAGENAEGAWRGEWQEIKSMLLGLAGDRLDYGRLTPRQRQALEYLEREGVGRKVLLALYARLSLEPQLSVLAALADLVAVAPWGGPAWTQRCHAFCGPSGVGKTATVLRLALAALRTTPAARIRLVSADDAGGKSRLVLRHYAALLGLTVVDLTGPDDVRRLRTETDGYDLTLIDLPSLPRGATLDGLLANLGLDSLPDLAVHVLLSPTLAPAQLEDVLARHRGKKTAGLIWTKLDEACTFGAMVAMGEACGLPISALSFGSGLKGSLVAAEQMTVWKLVFKRELPRPTVRTTEATETAPATTNAGKVAA